MSFLTLSLLFQQNEHLGSIADLKNLSLNTERILSPRRLCSLSGIESSQPTLACGRGGS
jgi:hypothetical protein